MLIVLPQALLYPHSQCMEHLEVTNKDLLRRVRTQLVARVTTLLRPANRHLTAAQSLHNRILLCSRVMDLQHRNLTDPQGQLDIRQFQTPSQEDRTMLGILLPVLLRQPPMASTVQLVHPNSTRATTNPVIPLINLHLNSSFS